MEDTMYVYNERQKEKIWVVSINHRLFLNFKTKIQAEEAREKILDTGIRFKGLVYSTDVPTGGIVEITLHEQKPNASTPLTVSGGSSIILGQ